MLSYSWVLELESVNIGFFLAKKKKKGCFFWEERVMRELNVGVLVSAFFLQRILHVQDVALLFHDKR